MKKSIIVMICLFLSMSLFSQEKTENKGGVIFDHGTLAESLAKAKKNKKGPNMVFLDCYTTWCGPCKQMANIIFPMEHVGKFFNANFVNIKIDMEKGEGIELAKKYGVRAYPTFLILDSDGNEINRIVGSGGADEFIERVKKAMDPKNSPKAKQEAYLKEKNMSNAKSYLEALEESYMNQELATFIEEEFNMWSARDRYSDDLWKYVSKTFADPNSKILDYIIADKLNADNYIGKQRLDKAICNGLKGIAYSYVAGRIKDADNNAILNKINYLALLSSDDATAKYFIEVSKLYANNNMNQILTMLKSNEFLSLGERERSTLEGFMLSAKGFPKESTLDYLKAKADYFKKVAESSEAGYKKFLEK